MSKMVEVDLVNFINATVSGVGTKPDIEVGVKRDFNIFTLTYKEETYYVKVYEEESSYGDYEYRGWTFVKPVKKEVTVWE